MKKINQIDIKWGCLVLIRNQNDRLKKINLIPFAYIELFNSSFEATWHEQRQCRIQSMKMNKEHIARGLGFSNKVDLAKVGDKSLPIS